MANIPLFRGVADRTGCSMAAPVKAPKVPQRPVPPLRGGGEGVAKAWRIFPSLEGVRRDGVFASGSACRESTKVITPSETPRLSGRGIWLPHPYPLIVGEGRPKHGEYSPL